MKEPIRIIEADSDTMELLDGSTLLDVIDDKTKLAVLEEQVGENELGEFLILNVAVEQKGLPWELCRKVRIKQWLKRFSPDRLSCRRCLSRAEKSTWCVRYQKNIKLDDEECDWSRAERLKLEKFKMDGNI